MPTVAHVERLGQLKPYDPNLGATLAAPLKVLFSQAVHDSDELAPEMAKPSPTETKFERKPAIAQYPVAELLRVQHHNPEIREFVDQYLRRVEWRQEILKEQMEAERLERADRLDEAALSRVDERREALYVSTWRGRDRPISIALATLDRQEQAIEQARVDTANLIILHERIRNVQQLLRYLNYWLVRVMEGRLAEGHEDFSRFIIAWVESLPFVSPKYRSVTASLDSVVKFYLSLVYGDPTIPCSIPFYLAKTQRLYTDTVTALEQEVRLAKELFWEEASQGQHKSEKRSYHYRSAVPENLEPRSLSTDERKQVLTACHAELFSNGKAQNTHALFEVINNFVRFCQLLHQPENHIKIPGTQYVETQVNTYTTQEMTNQMARELIDLPRFTAYAKVIQEQGGVQVVRKAKITTEELPKVPAGRLPEASRIARQNAIDAGILRPRKAIEAESRTRLERWRRRVLDNSPPPSEEPPPNRTPRAVSNGLPPTLEEPPPAKARSLELPKPEEPPSSVTPPTLQLVSLEFFESGKDVPKMEERQYNTRFPQNTTRFIIYEIIARNKQRERDQTYKLTDCYYRPDGTIFGTNQYDWVVKASSESCSFSFGWGWAEPGVWKPATYRVVILIDGVEFAEGSFEIEKTPPSSEEPPRIEKHEPVKLTEQVELGKASNLSIRAYGSQCLDFFESGKGTLEKKLRSYRFWFPQDTTRFINYEITLQNMYSFQGDRTYQMVVRYYNPDGSLLRTNDPNTWVMKSDTREIVLTGGIGWEEPGRWKIGDYRIEFSINGEEFAQTKFKILKPRRRRG